MKSCIFLTTCLALFTVGCHKNTASDDTRYDSEGKLKPAVAIVPVINSCGQQYTWNLSKELTHSLMTRLSQRDKLYLIDQNLTHHVYQQLGPTHNPFGKEIEWVKLACPDQEFAVFMELIEHEEVPLLSQTQDDPEKCSAEFNISVRLRVIDLRSEAPKIVLQEIIHDRHFIPRPFTKFHFRQEAWDDENQGSFGISPLGLAHAQIIKKVSSRIEEYITLYNP